MSCSVTVAAGFSKVCPSVNGGRVFSVSLSASSVSGLFFKAALYFRSISFQPSQRMVLPLTVKGCPAHFGGVFLHTVQYKADMFAVQFHKFCFYKLCRVVVPGDTDCSSFGADSFKNKGKDFLYPVPVKVSILYQIVVLDIVLDDFLIHAICVCRFLSLPFRRLCRVL